MSDTTLTPPPPSTINHQPSTINLPSPISNLPPPPPTSPPSPLLVGEGQGEVSTPPTSHFPLLTSKKSLLLLPLLAAVFILSFFFSLERRQPKPQSRASAPTPSPLGSLKSPQGWPKDSPGVEKPVPTSSSSTSGFTPPKAGFGSLVTKPTSPPQGEVSTPPTASSVSSPNKADPTSERAIFDIRAENDSFSPNQLTAYTGQVVVIYFTAVDKTYDVAFPDLSLKKIIRQGQKTPLEFQPNSFGQFVFLCQENCPEGTTAKGLLTIKP